MALVNRPNLRYSSYAAALARGLQLAYRHRETAASVARTARNLVENLRQNRRNNSGSLNFRTERPSARSFTGPLQYQSSSSRSKRRMRRYRKRNGRYKGKTGRYRRKGRSFRPYSRINSKYRSRFRRSRRLIRRGKFNRRVRSIIFKSVPSRKLVSVRPRLIELIAPGFSRVYGFSQGTFAKYTENSIRDPNIAFKSQIVGETNQAIGSLNAISSAYGSNTEFNSMQFYEISQDYSTIRYMNNTNHDIKMKIYYCKYRRDTDDENEINIQTMWDLCRSNDGLLPYVGLTPYESRTFVQKVKILSSSTRNITAGQQGTLKLSSKWPNKSKPYKGAAINDVKVNAKKSRHILLFLEGVPAHINDSDNVGDVTTTGLRLDMIVKSILKVRQVSINTPDQLTHINYLPQPPNEEGLTFNPANINPNTEPMSDNPS